MSTKVYYNGDIITMENTSCEAVLIKDGIIAETGNFKELSLLADEYVDLNGNTLLPGFIDSHSHITALAKTMVLIPLNNAKSFSEVISKMSNFKKEKNIPDGEWIIGFGYDDNSLKEHRHPTREVLDKISSTNPILISHVSGHMGCVNSLALRKMGITSETKDPKGGWYGRDDLGNPNGFMKENAFINNTSEVPKPSIEKMVDSIKEAEDIYLRHGITTVQDGLTKRDDVELLKRMSQQQKLRLDIVSYIPVDDLSVINENKDYLSYNNHLKIGGEKVLLDGSPQGKTAWLSKPYEGDSENYGNHTYTDEEIKSICAEAFKQNRQILVHANGDAACEQFINAVEYAEKSAGNIPRPVMIHAQLLRKDQLPRVKKLGIIPSFFVAHVFHWGDTHMRNLGERANGISPAKSALDNDILFTLHQDSPVIMPDMLETIWCAVNRHTASDAVIGADETIDVYEALKAVTINAAYQYFEENEKGSIKKGKSADFVILSRNPLKIDKMDIRNIQVLETIKSGKTLYKR